MTHPFHHSSVWLRQPLSLGPLIADVDFFVDNEDISTWTGASETATLTKSVISPARNLLVTLTDAASDTLDVTLEIVGKNQFGQVITESITVDYNAAATGETSNCFSEITSVTCTAANNATTNDKLDIGPGNRVALPFKVTAVSEVEHLTQVPAAATSATVSAAGSSTYVDLTYDCIKGLTITAGDVVCVTPQLKAGGSDNRFSG